MGKMSFFVVFSHRLLEYLSRSPTPNLAFFMKSPQSVENKSKQLISKRLSLAILISIIVHFVILILMGLWTVYQYVVEGDPGMEVSMETGDAEEMVEQPEEMVEIQEVVQQVEVEFDRLTVDPLFEQDLPMLNAQIDAVPTPVTPNLPQTVSTQMVIHRSAPRGSWGNVFGSSEESDFLLDGAFYDFKQTPDRKPSGISQFPAEVRAFVESGFDRRMLDRKFFRAPEARAVSFIGHPRMRANLAPQAYNLADVVQPERWIIHYRGTISPPRNGRYRFTAYADDQALVAIDGKVVVDGSRQKISDRSFHGTQIYGNMPNTNDSNYSRTSEWISMNANRDYSIDIIVGENPGGVYMAWIFAEEEGVTYEKVGNWPRLPLFSTIEMDGVPDWNKMMSELGVTDARVPPMKEETLAFPRR